MLRDVPTSLGKFCTPSVADDGRIHSFMISIISSLREQHMIISGKAGAIATINHREQFVVRVL